MPFYQFVQEQDIPASIPEVWDFISSPKNLKVITPPEMGFEITNEVPEKMYPGMIITYRVKPFPFYSTKWVTEITQVKEHEFFIDEQRVGPYSIWHHQHFIQERQKGIVTMKDIISYQPPLGFLGGLANPILVKPRLKQIFNYREKALVEVFGPLPQDS